MTPEAMLEKLATDEEYDYTLEVNERIWDHLGRPKDLSFISIHRTPKPLKKKPWPFTRYRAGMVLKSKSREFTTVIQVATPDGLIFETDESPYECTNPERLAERYLYYEPSTGYTEELYE